MDIGKLKVGMFINWVDERITISTNPFVYARYGRVMYIDGVIIKIIRYDDFKIVDLKRDSDFWKIIKIVDEFEVIKYLDIKNKEMFEFRLKVISDHEKSISMINNTINEITTCINNLKYVNSQKPK